MDFFTNEGTQPSERTLELIRQIAYSYRVVRGDDGTLTEMFMN
jgi:hypothetical protein